MDDVDVWREFENVSSDARVLHITSNFIISCRCKDENGKKNVSVKRPCRAYRTFVSSRARNRRRRPFAYLIVALNKDEEDVSEIILRLLQVARHGNCEFTFQE